MREEPVHTTNDRQSEAQTDTLAPSDDPVFREEQLHLSDTYAKLQEIGRELVRKMERTRAAAAADKRSMSEELAPNFATYADAMETYADFAAMNRVIDAYNLAQDADAERLANVELLLKQPYFAKVALQFKPGQKPKELYIGTAGIADEAYHRLVVDWRSPVAEVYYNQDTGPTSYVADGRTIDVDLKLRRQFDIDEDRLNAYFDTTVAIQDSLLLASLSKRRTAQMQAITATIQKEQNQVVRHEDVPVLLVSGIAGSGKTSVLLQRIAYLFYQMRGSLDAREVFLITPNPVFRDYIAGVLPDLGERNPESLTWNEFARGLLPPDRGVGEANVPLAALARIDAAVRDFEFDAFDFRDIRVRDVRLVSADSIRKLSDKLRRIPAGPHRVTLMREELHARLEARLAQMAGADETLDALSTLSLDEQLRIFHEAIAPADEQEERALALRYLRDRYADAFAAVDNDDWLRIDRVGMRLLNADGLSPLEWLYLKMALTGLGNPDAKYVMIDEVQDYTAAQLAVLARYFRRAHFLLLGDPNQAIAPGTATFDEVRAVFEAARGPVEECRLMTSYRSTPEITELFASLLGEDERANISAVQRADEPPAIVSCPDEAAYAAALREAVAAARDDEGLSAVIAPWKHEAKRLQKLLGDDAPPLADDTASLPAQGVVLITLKLAKGLEFDRVIVPDASERVFPADDPLSRRRLYTTLSRATRSLVVLAHGELTPLLRKG
ncbi:HelD family protein [Rubneribacter badeniensis]